MNIKGLIMTIPSIIIQNHHTILNHVYTTHPTILNHDYTIHHHTAPYYTQPLLYKIHHLMEQLEPLLIILRHDNIFTITDHPPLWTEHILSQHDYTIPSWPFSPILYAIHRYTVTVSTFMIHHITVWCNDHWSLQSLPIAGQGSLFGYWSAVGGLRRHLTT